MGKQIVLQTHLVSGGLAITRRATPARTMVSGPLGVAGVVSATRTEHVFRVV